MKIISWNINGLRAVVQKNFYEFLVTEKPDILCLQEVKMGAAAIEKEKLQFPGYEVFWNPAERPGYSGTAMLIRSDSVALKSPLDLPAVASAKEGRDGAVIRDGVCEAEEQYHFNSLPSPIEDHEGRIQHLELQNFHLLNVYFPNANGELSRLPFKLSFNQKLFAALKELAGSKPVLICGDFNVAHNEIDLARPKANIGSAGFTYEERDSMTAFLQSGFVDVFRELNPEAQEYTWWSYRAGARPKNIGWRIDYFCVSQGFLPNVKKIEILGKILGSDHCPVMLEVK